jgi:chromate transporter
MRSGPSVRQILWLFSRVGNLTFGGGDPTLAVFHQELVVSNRWITSDQYGLLYGLARVTPGTNVLAFCAGAGWILRRTAGALLTVACVSIPCAFLVVWCTQAYERLQSIPMAMAAIGGMLASATGLMIASAYLLSAPRWKAGKKLRVILLGGGALLLALAGLTPIQVLGLGALAGVVWPSK